MWWLAFAVVLASGPGREDVESWLGRYRAGPETIAFAWDEGLVYHHGHIPIPVDGEWHVTVPEFYVRHRATWLPETEALRLEESHDDSPPWRHELRFDAGELVKVSLGGGTNGEDVVVRRFERVRP